MKTWWGRQFVWKGYCIASQSGGIYGIGVAQPLLDLVIFNIFIHAPDDGTERIYRWQPAGKGLSGVWKTRLEFKMILGNQYF